MTNPVPVYTFGQPTDQANAPLAMVGGKGWHLIRMAAAGLPVPPGFLFGTDLCQAFFARGETLGPDFRSELTAAIRALESMTGCRLGGARRPLLVSVRSGAAASMPGMLDTVLNIGLSREAESGAIRMSGLPRQFWDSYARLVRSFGTTVRGVPEGVFAEAAALVAADHGDPSELDWRGWRQLAEAYEAAYRHHVGEAFPTDPFDQLIAAIEAVLRSWHGARAVTYRRMNHLSDAVGTAVIVQTMVFGNRGAGSGTGVAFTRNPATGEPGLYLDYIADAQGDDLVSGRRTGFGEQDLQVAQPGLLRELERVAATLEGEFRDCQDFEFTVEDGRLWLLQSRDAKRTPWAAVRIAAEQVREGLIDQATGRARLAHLDLGAVACRRLIDTDETPLGRAIPASPGVASGPIALSTDRASEPGQPPILVRRETSTDDLAGMAVASGVLTAIGSRTSHAAVVARQLGKVCLVGCGELIVEEPLRRCRLGGVVLHEGDVITLDGETGAIYRGHRDVFIERPDQYLATLGLEGSPSTDTLLVQLKGA